MGEYAKRRILMVSAGMGLAAAAFASAEDLAHLHAVVSEEPPRRGPMRLTRAIEAPPLRYAGDRRPRPVGGSPAQRLLERQRTRRAAR